MYLYFEYTDAKLSRNDYLEKINKILSLKKSKIKYEKNTKNTHQLLTKNGGSIEKAIINAKKLTNNNRFDNPSTAVWRFAEYFNPYIKK